jgi:hypothetical protein
VKISEPIFIRRTAKRGYEITGSLEGYGTIRRYGRSEEEVKDRFFAACDGAGDGTMPLIRRERVVSHCSPGLVSERRPAAYRHQGPQF